MLYQSPGSGMHFAFSGDISFSHEDHRGFCLFLFRILHKNDDYSLLLISSEKVFGLCA